MWCRRFEFGGDNAVGSFDIADNETVVQAQRCWLGKRIVSDPANIYSFR